MRKLLADRGYKERAEEFKRWAAAHDGAVSAANELERFAASSR